MEKLVRKFHQPKNIYSNIKNRKKNSSTEKYIFKHKKPRPTVTKISSNRYHASKLREVTRIIHFPLPSCTGSIRDNYTAPYP